MNQAQILIVEDEAIVAENIAGRLQQQGYGVVGIVDSGIAAILEAGRMQPDLVLMDIMLKGEVDGVMAAREIYSEFSIPVVYMTAFADDKTLQRAKSTEPFGYLVKPFKPHELRATIEVALRKQQVEAQMRRSLEQSEQLRQQAEEHNRLKSNFVTIISHELRNPLATLYLSTDLLETQGEKLDQVKRSKRFRHIRQSLQRMSELLDDVLSINRLETELPPLEPQKVDLVSFCQELIDEISLITEKEHEVRFICSPALVNKETYFDSKVLNHILINLLSNAVKYSPGGGLIELELNYQDIPQRVAIFTVRDQGIGIPEQEQGRLFEAFYRAKNVGKIHGSGLGLTIVKKYVDMQGGAIAIDSAVNLGTTVTVTLPLSDRNGFPLA